MSESKRDLYLPYCVYEKIKKQHDRKKKIFHENIKNQLQDTILGQLDSNSQQHKSKSRLDYLQKRKWYQKFYDRIRDWWHGDVISLSRIEPSLKQHILRDYDKSKWKQYSLSMKRMIVESYRSDFLFQNPNVVKWLVKFFNYPKLSCKKTSKGHEYLVKFFYKDEPGINGIQIQTKYGAYNNRQGEFYYTYNDPSSSSQKKKIILKLPLDSFVSLSSSTSNPIIVKNEELNKLVSDRKKGVIFIKKSQKENHNMNITQWKQLLIIIVPGTTDMPTSYYEIVENLLNGELMIVKKTRTNTDNLEWFHNLYSLLCDRLRTSLFQRCLNKTYFLEWNNLES